MRLSRNNLIRIWLYGTLLAFFAGPLVLGFYFDRHKWQHEMFWSWESLVFLYFFVGRIYFVATQPHPGATVNPSAATPDDRSESS